MTHWKSGLMGVNRMNDVISRQDAIDAVKSRKTAEQCEKGVVRNWAVDLCVDVLEKLPSSEPEKVCIAKITLSEEQVREAFEKAKDEIVQVLSSAESEQRWIPCSVRLPKKGEYVGNVAKYYLAQTEYGDMVVARYSHSGYWEQIYQLKPIADEIVAWMPLPKPYKGESEK